MVPRNNFFPPFFFLVVLFSASSCPSFVLSLLLEGRNGGGRRRRFAVSEWRGRGTVRDGVSVGSGVRGQTNMQTMLQQQDLEGAFSNQKPWWTQKSKIVYLRIYTHHIWLLLLCSRTISSRLRFDPSDWSPPCTETSILRPTEALARPKIQPPYTNPSTVRPKEVFTRPHETPPHTNTSIVRPKDTLMRRRRPPPWTKTVV